MRPNLHGCGASLILSLVIGSIPACGKSPAGDPRITILLYDYVNLTSWDRAKLAATVQRILDRAGVTTEFVDCFVAGVATGAPACKAMLGPADLVLRICRPGAAVPSRELGYAATGSRGGAFMSVFPRPVQIDGLSTGALLGHSAAHEIGHLLLGPNAHSCSGIMRPLMKRSDEELMLKGWLRFDTAQASKMRSALRARLSQ